MKRIAIENAHPSTVERQNHVASFAKVFDGRKQPIRRLWKRGDRYYAQLKIENAITGVKKIKRVPLVDKDNVKCRGLARWEANNFEQ